MNIPRRLSTFAALLLIPSVCPAAETPIKKEKLQIVFCFGQSNMVGLADPSTAWYLTQPQYVPPREPLEEKTRFFDWNFYWSGVRYYEGPRKAELDALVDARRDSRILWRQRINGELPWNEAEWGKKPGEGRSNAYAFLDEKAEQEGIYKRIAEILDAPDNQFPLAKAYEEMTQRDQQITAEIARIREIYINGATAADFDAFDAEVDAAVKAKTLMLAAPKGRAFTDAEKHRAQYAALAQKHLRLPIAQRTRIYGYGAIAGSEGEGIKSTTHGPLSVGYGANVGRIGPEYALGITLERLVDAPILLVKCSWGNTSIGDAWRPWSLDGVETPTEKANRELWNKKGEERAKLLGRPYTPRGAPEPTGKAGWCWELALPHIEKVLADPGQFHPGYDPKVGYEVAGMVWFQGYSDMENPAYGELLAQLIRDFRQKVKTPDMPVVCGMLGMPAFKNAVYSNEVNKGIRAAAQTPDLAGTVAAVNTCPFYPLELDPIRQILKNSPPESPEYKEALRMRERATSDKEFHYHGSAKFFLLAGDAFARSLAELMAKKTGK